MGNVLMQWTKYITKWFRTRKKTQERSLELIKYNRYNNCRRHQITKYNESNRIMTWKIQEHIL